MAAPVDERLINHILSNRPPYADALDLLALRDAIAALEAEIAELKGRKLAWVNKGAIKAKEQTLALHQLAEIAAREHVRASPVKTQVLKSEMAHRQAKVVTEQVAPATPAAPVSSAKRPIAPPPVPSQKRTVPSFDRAAFLTHEARARAKVATKVEDDEDELADARHP